MRIFIWIMAGLWLADAVVLMAGLREPSGIGSGISKVIVGLFLADMARTMGDKMKTKRLETRDAVADLLLEKEDEDTWHK